MSDTQHTKSKATTAAAPITKSGSAGKIIGILALQGDYDAHRKMLSDRLGAQTAYVRTSEELAQVDALVLPGGESTTIGKLMDRIGLDSAIRARGQAGMPIYGTCAGMILLAKTIEKIENSERRPDQPTLGLMDIHVARNAFGRQIDSFEADVPFDTSGSVEPEGAIRTLPVAQPDWGAVAPSQNETQAEAGNTHEDVVRGVFIRAPYVTEAGPQVRILGHFRARIVSVRQNNLLATAFHPELTNDPRVHAYFLQMVAESHETRPDL